MATPAATKLTTPTNVPTATAKPITPASAGLLGHSTVNKVFPIQPGTLPIPADYSALGVTRGYSPPTANQLRFFVVGPSGEGKSTFINSDPNSLILDYEKGSTGIPRALAARISISTAKQHNDFIKKLIADAKSGRSLWSRIVFDTVDQCIQILGAAFAADKGLEHFGEYGDKGAGYGVMKSRFWTDIESLMAAGYTWTIVGHLTERTVRVNRQDMTVLRPVIFESLNNIIYRNCEIFGMTERVTTVKQGTVTRTIEGKQVTIAVPGKDILTEEFMLRISSDVGAGGSSAQLKQAKVRGVPSFRKSIKLTGSGGWTTFSTAYNNAVATEKKRLASPVAPVKQ